MGAGYHNIVCLVKLGIFPAPFFRDTSAINETFAHTVHLAFSQHIRTGLPDASTTTPIPPKIPCTEAPKGFETLNREASNSTFSTATCKSTSWLTTKKWDRSIPLIQTKPRHPSRFQPPQKTRYRRSRVTTRRRMPKIFMSVDKRAFGIAYDHLQMQGEVADRKVQAHTGDRLVTGLQ